MSQPRLPGSSRTLSVHLAPMRGPEDQDQEHGVVYLVHDSIVPDADAVAVLAGCELLDARRSRVFGEPLHHGPNACLGLAGEPFEVAESGRLQLDAVVQTSESEVFLDALPRDALARFGEGRIGRRVVEPVLFLVT